MDLRVTLHLEEALDTCWEILAESFERDECGMPSDLIQQFWPRKTAQDG
jgi:V/A-type H+-transporting ATPase subunit B